LKNNADEQSEIISSEVALLISNVVEAREIIIKLLEEESSKLAILAENLSSSIQEISTTSLNNSEDLNNTVSKLIKTAPKNQNNLNETHDIVKLIQNVSNQTKMLGFNAAVEAHRAGNEGRGFRVVAKEIKELADETGNSVKRITHLIEDLNTSTQETFDNIEEMNRQTSRFIEVQEKTSSTLVNVADKIKELSTMLKKITK
jgi:methyl-accepting chemotaxis protein